MRYIRRECVAIILAEFNLAVYFAIAESPNFFHYMVFTCVHTPTHACIHPESINDFSG